MNHLSWVVLLCVAATANSQVTDSASCLALNHTDSDSPCLLFLTDSPQDFYMSRVSCQELDSDLYVPISEAEQLAVLEMARQLDNSSWSEWFIGGLGLHFQRWLSTALHQQGILQMAQLMFIWEEGIEKDPLDPERCVAYNATTARWTALQCQVKLQHVICSAYVDDSENHHLCTDPDYHAWDMFREQCTVARLFEVPEGLSWYGASDYCVGRGFNLFPVQGNADEQALKEILHKHSLGGDRMMWIGVHSSFFSFVNGNRITFDGLLDATEQTEEFEGEHCLVMSLELEENKAWKLTQCLNPLPAVCVRRPTGSETHVQNDGRTGFYKDLLDHYIFSTTTTEGTTTRRNKVTTFDWRFLYTTAPGQFSSGSRFSGSLLIINCLFTVLYHVVSG